MSATSKATVLRYTFLVFEQYVIIRVICVIEEHADEPGGTGDIGDYIIVFEGAVRLSSHIKLPRQKPLISWSIFILSLVKHYVL